MYVSMQYGWEKNRRSEEKKNPENFFNCHHDAASLPIRMPDASVPSPLVWGSSRRVVLGTHTYMYHFIVMNYIHVFNVFE